MAKLTAKTRNALPPKDFAGPGRSYPVEDKAHAAAAKSRVAEFGSPALKARVDADANKVLKAARGTSNVLSTEEHKGIMSEADRLAGRKD